MCNICKLRLPFRACKNYFGEVCENYDKNQLVEISRDQAIWRERLDQLEVR